ncbi:M23 family metallopeptidase [Parabacteroides bouchesdurhonensis]|uniref:M23 family metallopeptidase n=1 Tax=Parabacteroides bouchesdurhonensis TaxID=1936995 RepID=UPI000C830EE7|nr:M23 family metallopeptidase [Parabacteroides bouchesdurhonensis]
MTNKILYWLIFIILITISACSTFKTQKNHKSKFVTSTVEFPSLNIPLPTTDFNFIFADSIKLEDMYIPKRKISNVFTFREKSYVSVKDSALFANNNTEIIDLTLIPKEKYAFPLPNGKIISPYGGRRKHHSGTDIKTRANDTIVAAFDGVVRMSKPFAAYGNVIVIRHYNGLETVYSHNSKNLVKSGDYVKAGTPIALTGRTGRATTEHLHFETRINGKHFNPNLVFNMETRELYHKYLICKKQGDNIIVQQTDIMPHQLTETYNNMPQ